MATSYVGKRPVLRGRNESEFAFQDVTKTLSGKTRSAVGVYSFYPNFGPGVLTGGPDNNHVIGTGYSPHDVFMSRRYRGLDTLNPLDNPGSGARLTGFRYHPWEYKGLVATRALGNPGHPILTPAQRSALTFAEYDNYTFDGVASSQTLTNPGHKIRYINAPGTANSFGYFDPFVNKGVTTQPLAGASQTVPTDYNHLYGRNRVLEWRGTPSSKAL